MTFLSIHLKSATSAVARAAQFIALTKPGLTFYAVCTAMLGAFLAGEARVPSAAMLHTFIGTSLIGAGSVALNQVIERRRDSRMRRTSNRPIPGGRVTVAEGLTFGGLLAACGVVYLGAFTNMLAAMLGLSTILVYLSLYTPLKARTQAATLVGAIPGALPPVIGWAVVRNHVDLLAYVLFAVLFFWQIPHFLALGWMYREDYKRGGYRILPVIDEGGKVTSRLALLYSLALLPASILPTVLGAVGAGSLLFIVPGSAFLVFAAFRFAQHQTDAAAKDLFAASLVFVPAFILACTLGALL